MGVLMGIWKPRRGSRTTFSNEKSAIRGCEYIYVLSKGAGDSGW